MFYFFLLAAVATVPFAATSHAVEGWTYMESQTCSGTYAEPCPPAAWGNVSHDCDGGVQSPIDISNAVITADLESPVFSVLGGGCSEWEQFSLNGTFEVSFEHCRNMSLVYNGSTYDFLQMHFHSPSEHSIGGGYYAGEAHLVHRNENMEYLVLGLMLQVSGISYLTPSNNSMLDILWTHGAGDTFKGEEISIIDEVHPINPYYTFMPASPVHYVYSGSFTTPPCTEGVQWLVYDQAVTISQDDLNMLRRAIAALPTTIVSSNGNNARWPAMPRNGRQIRMYSGVINTECTSTSTSSSGDDSTAVAIAVTSLLFSFSLFIFCILIYFDLHKGSKTMDEADVEMTSSPIANVKKV